MAQDIPEVFISYAWEDDEHKTWVKSFANHLIEDGIDAIVDQYDLTLGDRLPHFMESSIANADYVLIICTPKYKEKSDDRKGGVGYEGHIISAELLNQGNERKFIPVIRKGNISESLPVFLVGKLAIDLTDGKRYNENYADLITTLRGEKRKPTVRNKYGVQRSYPSTDTYDPSDDEEIKILRIITVEGTVPKMDGTRGSALYKISFKLSKSPSHTWRELFLKAWDLPPRFTLMHRPGIASVQGDKIILNGTTIEEVRDYHRDTLKLCVDKANEEEKALIKKERARKEAEKKRINNHYSNVNDIAGKIDF